MFAPFGYFFIDLPGMSSVLLGANSFADVLGFFPSVFRWPGAIPDAPGLVLPVVDGPFFPECNVPFLPVGAPLEPVVEFLTPVSEPVVLWAEAAEAAATANPAATKPIAMRFMVEHLSC